MHFQVKFERYYTGMQVASLLCDSHLGRCLYYMEAAVLESGEVEARGYRNVGPEHRGGREGQVPVTKIFI